jgi:hypothetical protein
MRLKTGEYQYKLDPAELVFGIQNRDLGGGDIPNERGKGKNQSDER